MHLRRSHRDKLALAATVMGVVLISAALTGLLGGGGGDEAQTGQGNFSGSPAIDPFSTGVGETPDPSDLASTSNELNRLTGKSGADPFATSSGSDNTVHEVVIKFVSDGGMYTGWRYRTKGGEGLKVAARTWSVSKSVRGGLPVAQAAVQVLSTASYATCTIYVDGVAVSTQTANGANHVTVCVG